MVVRKKGAALKPDVGVRHRLRPELTHHADSLLTGAHTVAVEFATIAAANHYWRDSLSEVAQS